MGGIRDSGLEMVLFLFWTNVLHLISSFSSWCKCYTDCKKHYGNLVHEFFRVLAMRLNKARVLIYKSSGLKLLVVVQ